MSLLMFARQSGSVVIYCRKFRARACSVVARSALNTNLTLVSVPWVEVLTRRVTAGGSKSSLPSNSLKILSLQTQVEDSNIGRHLVSARFSQRAES